MVGGDWGDHKILRKGCQIYLFFLYFIGFINGEVGVFGVRKASVCHFYSLIICLATTLRILLSTLRRVYFFRRLTLRSITFSRSMLCKQVVHGCEDYRLRTQSKPYIPRPIAYFCAHIA